MAADLLRYEKIGGVSSPLLEETQRVLNEQVNIVQEQQAQATRIIRVALTVGGLFITVVSVFLSSPFFSGNISEIPLPLTPFQFALVGLAFIYTLLFLLVIFGKIFGSALIVLSPESGGLSLIVNNPLAEILSIYRKWLLPQPFSSFLIVGEEEEGMSLRPGIDGDEVQSILNEEMPENAEMDRIISYNAGCIQGNEYLIEENRARLSEIYTICVVALLVISAASILGVTTGLVILL